MKTLFLWLLLFCQLLLRADEQLFVETPSGRLNQYGAAASDAPFTKFDANVPVTMRYQQVYDSSLFQASVPAGGLIEGVGFRPDEGILHGWGGFGPTVEISLSTTSRSSDSLSPVFADNLGLDKGLVFPQGSFTVEVLPKGGPSMFGFFIKFVHPFFFDPRNGNLLLDVKNFHATDMHSGIVPFQPLLDAVDEKGDGVSRVVAYDVNATQGETVDSLGLATRFYFHVVPEPSLALMLLPSLGIAWGVVQGSRRRNG